MKIQSKAIVNDVFVKKDKGRTYLTFIDLETGGIYNLSLDGITSLKPGDSATIEAIVKPRVYKGMTALEYIGGNINRNGGDEK